MSSNMRGRPTAQRLALIVADEDPRRKKKGEEDKTPPPIVIDRYYFKEDETGYLGNQRQHLYVFDVASRKAELLTPGRYDEGWPAWSPDGKQIAFFSKRGEDPDRSDEFGLYVIAAQPAATPRLVTNFQGESGDASAMARPSWRPDGRELAFVAGGDPKLIYYATNHLAVVSADGGTPRILTRSLDRNVLSPVWARNGRAIYFLLEDDGNQHLARIETADNSIERLVDGRRETMAYDIGGKERIAVLDGIVEAPDAVYALDERRYRRLTHHNDEWLAGVKLGATEEISYASKDGTRINGFIVKPPDYRPGRRYPTLLWIHGGPVSQYAQSFSMSWQIFAAHGYVVLGANPRGSSGRGEAFAKAIYADWGNKDMEDVLGAVDFAVKQGVADADRLGVGGWSYGGILTNFVIAKDHALQIRDQRRVDLERARRLRHRHVHPRVRAGARHAVEESRHVAAQLLSVPARRPHQDADAVPVRRQRFQRAAVEFGADVPGAAQPGRRHAARDLSGAASTG